MRARKMTGNHLPEAWINVQSHKISTSQVCIRDLPDVSKASFGLSGRLRPPTFSCVKHSLSSLICLRIMKQLNFASVTKNHKSSLVVVATKVN